MKYEDSWQEDADILSACSAVGKTHVDATKEELRQGTHRDAQRKELSQFAKLSVFGKRFASAEEARSHGYQVIDLRSVDTWKFKPGGEERVAKSRFVMRGFMQRDQVDAYVHLPSSPDYRMAIIYGLSTRKRMGTIDIVTAYLQAPLRSDTKIAARFPPNLVENGDFMPRGVYQVLKAVYGLKESGKLFVDKLKDTLIEQGWTNVRGGIFKRKSDYIVAYIDDVLIVADDPEAVRNEINTKMECTEFAPLNGSRFLGTEIAHNEKKRTASLSVAKYAQGLIIPIENKKKVTPSVIKALIDEPQAEDDRHTKEAQKLGGQLTWIGG